MHQALVDDLGLDAPVDFPLVRVGLANRVARRIPLGIADENQLAAVAGGVAVEHVRAIGRRERRHGPVGLAGVVLGAHRVEAQRRRVVEVGVRGPKVERDGLASARDSLVVEVLADLRVRTLVRRRAVREGRDVEVLDLVGRTVGDDVGREGARRSVLDVLAGHG